MLKPVIVMGMVMAAVELMKSFIPEEKKEKTKKVMPFAIQALADAGSVITVHGSGVDSPSSGTSSRARIFSAGTWNIYAAVKTPITNRCFFITRR